MPDYTYPAKGELVAEYIFTQFPEQEAGGFVPVAGICCSFQQLKPHQGCSALLKRSAKEEKTDK